MASTLVQNPPSIVPSLLWDFSLIHRDEFDQSLSGAPHRYAAQTGRDILEKQFQEYAASLPSGGDGTIDPAILSTRNCPLCNGAQQTVLFVKYRFPVCRCSACGFVFANPILNENTVHAGYMDMGEMSRHHLSLVTQDFYRACARKRFEFELQQVLLRSPRPPRTYLEIGCSVGTGLGVARDYGIDAIGIEPNADAAAIALQEGHQVMVETFKAGLFDDARFDIVACMDVVEHLTDPVGFLRQIRNVLSDDGLALIQVPNAGGLISMVEGEKNQIYNGLIHFSYFDCSSLDRAAKRAGMESAGTLSVLSELGKLKQYSRDTIIKALKREQPELVPSFALHQDWINGNGLGYKVIGIYKKMAL